MVSYIECHRYGSTIFWGGVRKSEIFSSSVSYTIMKKYSMRQARSATQNYAIRLGLFRMSYPKTTFFGAPSTIESGLFWHLRRSKFFSETVSQVFVSVGEKEGEIPFNQIMGPTRIPAISLTAKINSELFTCPRNYNVSIFLNLFVKSGC